MRSESEIRREVVGRLRRRSLWLADAGFWLLTGFAIYEYSQYSGFGRFSDLIVPFMFLWTGLLGLHTLAVLYIEMRERLVRQAIEREREFYALQVAYEKRKRDDSASLPVDARLSLPAEDGEWVDFPFRDDPDAEAREKHAFRNRDS